MKYFKGSQRKVRKSTSPLAASSSHGVARETVSYLIAARMLWTQYGRVPTTFLPETVLHRGKPQELCLGSVNIFLSMHSERATVSEKNSWDTST